ncbi:unnamed protein product [Caenorhabditis sp. 36 PRJEB53466]|nr:unnamed protein product [Caenorhabditis sp. 36 PRJEB53466]
MVPVLAPHVVSMSKLVNSDVARLEPKDEIFRKFGNDNRRAYDALLATCRLGLSRVLAMANKDKDHRLYTSIVENVVTAQGKPMIVFELSNLSGPSRLSQWARATPISVQVNGDRSLAMEVDSASLGSNRLVVTARSNSGAKEQLQFVRTLKGVSINVSQPIEDNAYLLKDFPCAGAYDKISSHAPVKILLETALGGPPLRTLSIPDRNVELDMGTLVPTAEQARSKSGGRRMRVVAASNLAHQLETAAVSTESCEGIRYTDTDSVMYKVQSCTKDLLEDEMGPFLGQVTSELKGNHDEIRSDRWKIVWIQRITAQWRGTDQNQVERNHAKLRGSQDCDNGADGGN